MKLKMSRSVCWLTVAFLFAIIFFTDDAEAKKKKKKHIDDDFVISAGDME